MKFKSILKPDGSVFMGIATMAFVAFVYTKEIGPSAVVYATKANDRNIDTARKKATWTSLGAISAITLLTHDVNVFILGGATAIALDWHTRHANASHPATGELVSDQEYGSGMLRAVPDSATA